MKIVDKAYLMHDDEGLSYINELMNSGDDIDISAVGRYITPTIANMLDNYVKQGHRVITSDVIYNNIKNPKFYKNVIAGNTVYIGFDTTDFNNIVEMCTIAPVVSGLNSVQVDIVYLKCLLALLEKHEINVAMKTDDLKNCLYTFRRYSPNSSISTNTKLFIMFKDENVAYIDYTKVNGLFEAYRNENMQNISIEDYMLLNNIFPAYLVGTAEEYDAIFELEASRVINEIKTLISRYKKEERFNASELLGV